MYHIHPSAHHYTVYIISFTYHPCKYQVLPHTNGKSLPIHLHIVNIVSDDDYDDDDDWQMLERMSANISFVGETLDSIASAAAAASGLSQ